MGRMFLTVIAVGLLVFAYACSPRGRENQAPAGAATPKAQATPARNLTAADVEKLKWIEGTWQGRDGQTPFYERYRFEGTTMIVESLKADGTVDGEPGRFELKDGEFGKGEGEKRSAASEITDTYVQFVPGIGAKGNNYRFTRQADGTWHALLEWPARGDKAAQTKLYTMDKWTPEK